ncbi:hypothetical protein F5B20DRAFT_343054 [Whalleya microplaca]|nr:hypothetical protein F5B20DRAFT_343054 [Whalleya microplaca]
MGLVCSAIGECATINMEVVELPGTAEPSKAPASGLEDILLQASAQTSPTTGPGSENSDEQSTTKDNDKQPPKDDYPLLVYDPTIWAPHGPEFFHPPGLKGIPVVKHHAHVTGLWARKSQLVGQSVFPWWYEPYMFGTFVTIPDFLEDDSSAGSQEEEEEEWYEEAPEWYEEAQQWWRGAEIDIEWPETEMFEIVEQAYDPGWGEYLLATADPLGKSFRVHAEDPDWPLS